MKLSLVFSGEGVTDQRFIPVLTERIIKIYCIKRKISVELDWILVPKKGTSHENILDACKSVNGQNVIIFHRDSGNSSWHEAYNNHFDSASKVISQDTNKIYNKNLVPAIPVKEIESWMLCNKNLLKEKIETNLSDKDLGLTYKISRIEEIRDPKSKIESAIQKYHNTLPKKKQKYAVKIGDLYDAIALEIAIEELETLDSFARFKIRIEEVLDILTRIP